MSRDLGVDLLLAHLEVAREVVKGSLRGRNDRPEVRGEDSVSGSQSDKGSLDKVAHGCAKMTSQTIVEFWIKIAMIWKTYWRCYHETGCSSQRYQRAGACAWKQGQPRCRYHGGQG